MSNILRLRDKANSLPSVPGVYIMKDFKVVRGVYPTMITPYKNGVIVKQENNTFFRTLQKKMMWGSDPRK